MIKRISVVVLAFLIPLLAMWYWSNHIISSAKQSSGHVEVPVVVAQESASEAAENAEEEGDDEDEDTDVAKQNLALFFGHDDRVPVPVPYTGAYAAIGKLQTVHGSNCTATLIAPDLAVTAAHCFLMVPHKVDAGKWFWAGYQEGKWQARYKVIGQVFHPAFRKGLDYKGNDVYIQPAVAAYDIALFKVKLLDGHAPKPMPVYSGNSDDLLARIQHYDSKITQAGYAHDHNQVMTAHHGCLITALVDNNTLDHQCDTLAGDSGSPLWLETENGPLLIAIQSSAPDWFNRDKADNTAVTVLQMPKKPK